MTTRDVTEYPSTPPHLKTLERQVDTSPGDTDLLIQLYHAYRRAGRFAAASEIRAIINIPDTRCLEE